MTNKILYGGAISGPIGVDAKWRRLALERCGATWTQIKTALNAGTEHRSSVFRCHTDRGRDLRECTSAMAIRERSLRRTRRAFVSDGRRRSRGEREFHRLDSSTAGLKRTESDDKLLRRSSGGRRQCWYDNVVYSPPGKPDVVYMGGSYSYNTDGFRNNGRAFIRSSQCRCDVHRYDMGRNDEPDSARDVLPTESGRAEWHAPRLVTRLWRFLAQIQRSSARMADSCARAERSPTFHLSVLVPRAERRESGHLPAVAISRSEFHLQS